MPKFDALGTDWLLDKVDQMPDRIIHMGPVEFNEAHRYLPQGVSPRPGYIRYDLFPYLREILECFDIASAVREVNLQKGVQVGYTTLLESILFYVIGHVKTAPLMFISAERELVTGRIENNIIPMLIESDMNHLIRSHDVGNSRKTGQTKDQIQWEGGGFMLPRGAQNAIKMRQDSVPWSLKDELDGWKRSVGKDGNSDTLTDARLSAYWNVRKIARGSTPLVFPSMINEAFLKGDQREYMVLCRACSFPQMLRMTTTDKETGVIGGFKWDFTTEGNLVLESVRYCCQDCGHEHFETDKERLFSTEHGAHWKPTAVAREPGIRSYHLPSWYSPFGFRPWYKGVSDYLEAYDPVAKETRSVSKLQEFYNNTLGVPFRVLGGNIRFTSVSLHRRAVYRLGEVPNEYAKKFSGSEILFLTCQVDVHKRNLAVTVMGWARDSICYVIDYWRFERANEDDDCGEITSPVWGRLREVIEEKTYTADDGAQYPISLTLVDAGWSNATVVSFCQDYPSKVYPVLGRDRPGKNQTIKEFSEFTTIAGTVGYKITVDHYKDRIAPVLRREWHEENGLQKPHHFNAPVDITDKQLTELTVETRQEKEDDKGNVSYAWHRPGNAPNELFDLLGYGHAAVEILAWIICIQHFELETIDWPRFWDYMEQEKLGFLT